MRTLSFHHIFASSLLIAVFSASASRGHAYSASQESQWKQDIAEAKARALDFEKHLARQRNLSRERESAAHEIKRERKIDDLHQQQARESFVVERNRRPDPDIIELQMERAHEKIKAVEALEQLKIQSAYAASHEKVDQMIRKEAFINPAIEYDVHSMKSVEEQAKTQGPAPLKFRIEKSGESKP